MADNAGKVDAAEVRGGPGLKSTEISDYCGVHKNLTTNQTVFDLSGAAASETVFTAATDCTIFRAKITYIEATSGDAGVLVEVGIDGATTDADFFATSTSSISQSAGDSEDMTLLQTALAEGNVLTLSHAGGKTGTGTCFVTVEYGINDVAP